MINKVFVDTNFIIDLISRPEFSDKAAEVLTAGKAKNIIFSICFLSLANYAYIDRKQDRKKLSENLRMITKVFKVLPNDKSDIDLAIELNAKDFEDAIQYSTAIKGNCDCIITRNEKDFLAFSKIPVFSPTEFLNQLKKL